MKRLGLAAVVLALSLWGRPARSGEEAAPEEARGKEMAARVSAVTVYVDAALVTRTAKVGLKGGAEELAIKDAPGWIDEQSIRVSVKAPAACKLLGVTTVKTFLTKSPREAVRKAEDEVQKLRDSQQALNDQVSVLHAEKAYLESVKLYSLDKLTKDVVLKDVQVKDYDAVLKFIVAGLGENLVKVRQIETKMRDLQPEIRAKERALADLRASSELERRRIVVAVDSPNAQEAEISVSYLLPGATWVPSYDIRARTGAAEAEVTLYAIVQQSTGEDWEDAELTLSAVRPHVATRIPELKPWFLSQGAPLAQQNAPQMEQQQDLGAGQVLFLDNEDALLGLRNRMKSVQGKLQAAQKQMETNMQEAVGNYLRQTAARGTSALFPAAKRETVRTDGHPVRATIYVRKAAVRQHRVACPLLSPNTYLAAALTNDSPYPMLAGKVNVHLDGELVGASSMDMIATNETLDLALGADERVKVERVLDSKKSSVGTFSRRKRIDVAYRIEMENFRDEPVQLTLTDRMPVSQDQTFRVNTQKIAPKPDEEDRGVMTWNLTLKPRQKTEVVLSYSVDYPEDIAPSAAPALYRLEEQVKSLNKK